MKDQIANALVSGMNRFASRIEEQKQLYSQLLRAAAGDSSQDPVYRITDPSVFSAVLSLFGPALTGKNAHVDLQKLYEAGIHKKTGALIISNKGATLYSLSPKTERPFITRHIGLCVYMPGCGIEFVNVGLVGNVYDGPAVLRSESACTPSFLFGSQRCNCAHQWDSANELAAYFHPVEPPVASDGAAFESWVQKQVSYTHGKHVHHSKRPGFILMHVDTQNGMGSGYTPDEFSYDLFCRGSLRHRGEYSAEQIAHTTMAGGFEAIGIPPDPRKEDNEIGYQITYVLLDYLRLTKHLIFLSNNTYKIHQLETNGYDVTRVKSVGAVNLAGAQEAEQRGTEFHHLDINGASVSFDEEFKRLVSALSDVISSHSSHAH